jgi:hypothetical protein
MKIEEKREKKEGQKKKVINVKLKVHLFIWATRDGGFSEKIQTSPQKPLFGH